MWFTISVNKTKGDDYFDNHTEIIGYEHTHDNNIAKLFDLHTNKLNF